MSETLAQLVDRFGLAAVLDALAGVCYDRAASLALGQNTAAARVWTLRGVRVERAGGLGE
jgi:hypothetical protein